MDTTGQLLDYFGFEWSSLDSYNTLQFYDMRGCTGGLVNVPGWGTTIAGSDVRANYGLANDASGRSPDAFVNFSFPSDTVRCIAFSSWDNTAFEFDNVTLGYRAAPAVANALAAVPEPASLAAFGLGAAFVVAVRRRVRGQQ